MDLIGVIDLKAGQAVYARGGVRAHYAPIATIGDTLVDGDPLVLARGYVERFGLSTLYAADLDAIAGGLVCHGIAGPLVQVAPLWLDAGVSSVPLAQEVIDLGASRAVVGLETLPSFEVLAGICASIGSERVAFSVDLLAGEPVLGNGRVQRSSAQTLALRAADAGATALIVIDLARVGARVGPDFDLLARVRSAVPDAILFAGGGVRDFADLTRLADAGCDGALVASALHDGTLSAADVRAAGRLHHHGSATR